MLNTNSRWWVMVGLLIALSLNFGCNDLDSGSDGTGSEVASAAIGGTITASEGLLAVETGQRKQTFLTRLESSLTPINKSWAVPACDWYNLISSCHDNVETISYDDCSLFDRAVSLQGSETFFWEGSGCCTSNPLSASSQTPCSFNRRTVNKNNERDPLIRSVGSHSITLDTENSSGYSDLKVGGFTVSCQGTDSNKTCDGQRKVAIQGAHYTGQSGRALWDHTVSTDSPLIVQGHGSSRTVLSGKIRTQHNLAKYVSITTIASPLTYEKGCCFPTGGSISTSFVDGPFNGKSETVTFGPDCGSAVLGNSLQKRTGLTLRHCL